MTFQIEEQERNELERAYREKENLELILFNIKKFNLNINKNKYIKLLQTTKKKIRILQATILKKYTNNINYTSWQISFSQRELKIEVIE